MFLPADKYKGQGAGDEGQGKILQLSRVSRSSPLAPSRCSLRTERGIALLIVLSLVTIIAIMGVAFLFSMYLEYQSTSQFVSVTQAKFIAEAGVSHGRALLYEDGLITSLDDESELWVQETIGTDVDVDSDGVEESKWWPVQDASGNGVGQYAIVISDESSKININAAQVDPLGDSAVNLAGLLAVAGIADSANAATRIEEYRYGADQKPGVAFVDDDGDGSVDEADEYQSLTLRGDDRRFETLEDLVPVIELEEGSLLELSKLITVYTMDVNVSYGGQPRTNINTATAEELLFVLLEAGVENPWQAAANMADYVDSDLAFSHVMKSSQVINIPDSGPLGGWLWETDPSGHYSSDDSHSQELIWNAPVPNGEYRILARGISGTKICDLTVEDVFVPSADPGEFLGIFDLRGSLRVSVNNRESSGTCAFVGLELVSDDPVGGSLVRGIEAIRFNELMVEPTKEYPVSDAIFNSKGSSWSCPGSSVCQNSGVGQARWVWTDEKLVPGYYHVWVHGSSPGQTVGIVDVGGDSELLVDGSRHPSTLSVGSDGKVSLAIGKTDPEETYYLERIILSLQPDGEYLELINLSSKDIDISGWTIDGAATGGREARLPFGSVVKAHGLLIVAVDLDDSQLGIGGNQISVDSAWELPSGVEAVQLEFPAGALTADEDWLKITVPPGLSPTLILRSGEGIVDQVEYPIAGLGFQSLEKGDPTIVVDSDLDGYDEGWFPSLKLYTPGALNDNSGMSTVEDLVSVLHNPSEEIDILNQPAQSVGELAGLSSGIAWKPFASADLARMVDRITIEGLALEAEDQLVSGMDSWQETVDGYTFTGSASPEPIGTWQWIDIPNGPYRLSVYGWAGESFSVRWQQADGLFTEWSPVLLADEHAQVLLGRVVIGPDINEEDTGGTPSNVFTLDVRCQSEHFVCHLDRVQLDPQLVRVGAVNINTASREVLLVLPGMTDQIVSRLMSQRPFGNQDEKRRGIGDLLTSDVLGGTEEDKLGVFKLIANLVTIRSNVFQIISFGQAKDGDRITATQRVKAIIERPLRVPTDSGT